MPSCPLPTHSQENYELYQVELGPGPSGDMAAKMSKKKAGRGGGKRKEKLENMKKEMEIVSRGRSRARGGVGGGSMGGQARAGLGAPVRAGQ